MGSGCIHDKRSQAFKSQVQKAALKSLVDMIQSG